MTFRAVPKVVHLTPDAGAIHPYILQLGKCLRALGVQLETVRPKIFLKEVLELHPDIIHIHWLDPYIRTQLDWSTWLSSFFRLLTFVCQLAVVSARRIKIVWTVHELEIPESRYPDLDKICIKLLVSLSHAIVTHCADAQRQVIDTYCSASPWKVKVVPHGNFTETMENGINRSDARRLLNISESDFVVLFFGRIRPYKGVLELIQAHKQLSRQDVLLFIVGQPFREHKECADYVAKIEQSVCGLQNVRLELTHIRDEEIQTYMNASNVVAFPYRSIMTSGALIAAMGFGKPCIAPRLGCIAETIDDRGAFLYESSNKSALLDALKACLDNVEKLPEMGEHNRQLAENMNWQRIAERTLEVYNDCIARNCAGKQLP